MQPRPPLADHQRTGIEWIQRVKRGLLADEMGLGKTRTAIQAFDGSRVLVIAPAMVVTGGTWADELERWADHPDLFTVVPYSRLNSRVKTENGGYSPTNALRPELRQRWDAVIVDEAHYTKGRGTHWTGAVERLAKNAGAVLEMTGTPISNWAPELYTILRVLHPERARPGADLGSYWRWAARWFDVYNPTENLPPHLYRSTARAAGEMKACYPECLERPAHDPCEHYQRFVRENLGERFLRRTRDQVLDLPPLTEQQVLVPMDAATRKHYRRLRDELVTTLEDGQQVVAWSSGSKQVLLDQLTTSPWFLTRDGEPRGGKLEQLRFDLETRSRPTLVLAHYRSTVEACARVAESLGARTGYVHGGVGSQVAGEAVRAFKEGRLDVLVGSLDTLAEGLTLTVADMAIFVEKSFRPSRNEQAMRRVHRMGQERPVTVRDYVCPKSVDEKKRALLAVKTDRQMRVLSAADYLALT